MIKLLLPLMAGFMLVLTFSVHSQELTVDDEKLKEIDSEISLEIGETAAQELKQAPVEEVEELPEVQTDESLWEEIRANMSLDSLSVYLAAFPNGKHARDARAKFQDLEEKARARAKEDKALEAYRKRRIAGGLVLELDSKFTDVKPYVRSMLNSCGYKLVKPHRFAKRVYPTLVLRGQMFNSASDAEHSVTLDFSLVLKTKTREIKAREKMRSYRTSSVDTHQALIAAFEDIGAQMRAGGFCLVK